MEICFAGLIIGIFGFIVLVAAWSNRKGGSARSFTSYTHYDPDEILPNGYRRSDYYAYGWSDMEIECWGLDTPAAPDPWAAGWVVWDMLDGDIDGEFDTDFGLW